MAGKKSEPGNLVIVESPAKAKTIEGFLGKDFIVKSSYGHIRDLPDSGEGVNIKNNFEPVYVIPEEKKKVVDELKKASKNAGVVWLATDEDREGEAISWHLMQALGLKEDNVKRIVFHEITKSAILNAIDNPRKIDLHLVNAQQARRVLDRLVGFELSPVLWKKVKPSLSAGRVQSVAVRLLVEREREIAGFTPVSSFKVTGFFSVENGSGGKSIIKADLAQRFSSEGDALMFLEKLKGAQFSVGNLEKKPVTKSPSPPFTTSTLQQEASRKLSFSVQQTMIVAQQLYEQGKITYMRTDSVNLSELAMNASKAEITKSFGPSYVFSRQFKTKSASAQEAHEAIRPTYFENHSASLEDERQNKLYDLIWKRAIASQMANAELEKTIISIANNRTPDLFIATGEIIKFDGFLKVYIESIDEDEQIADEEADSGLLPPLEIGQSLNYNEIKATQKFSYPPPRYTEASLVKKMEALGIGRPSTYAPTISTIQKRGYVDKDSRMGRERSYKNLVLKNDSIVTSDLVEITGAEKFKLFPTDIGVVVTDFLIQNFKNILDYNFTAKVESEFDEIADGKVVWNNMIRDFYIPFHKNVEDTTQNSERAAGDRILGKDPKTGKVLLVRIGRYGPMAQIGAPDDEEKKFAKLKHGQRIETITFEEALDLFKLPRVVGMYEEEEVVASIGRFGPYFRHKGVFYSIPKTDDVYTVELPRAIEIIEEKKKAAIEKIIKVFPENDKVRIEKGRWGPFLKFEGKNVALPKKVEPESLTYEECVELAKNFVPGNKKGKRKK